MTTEEQMALDTLALPAVAQVVAWASGLRVDEVVAAHEAEFRRRSEVDELVRAAGEFLEADPPSDLSRRSEDDAYRAARRRLVGALAPFLSDDSGGTDG